MKGEINNYSVELKNKICRLAYRLLQNEEEAKDVTQEVFEKTWKKRHQLGRFRSIVALSLKMAKDICTDRIRHRIVQQKFATEFKHTTSTILDNIPYETKDLAELAKQLINNLPPKQQLIIHLRDIEGLEFEEIKNITEMKTTAIRMNLSRARKTIRKQMIKIMNHGTQ
jgi:RNA polymerase sigma-70 factor (ECF subfamily)